jgi:hypothetical protein
MLSSSLFKISWKRINVHHIYLVLLEMLVFALSVGTCHYTGDFSPEKRGFEIGSFSSFLVIVCFHYYICPCVFLRLATVATSAITGFRISNISNTCISEKNRHIFWKIFAKEMKCENENMGPWNWNLHHIRF